MSTEMVRINITIPLALSKELNQFSGPRKKSQFIADAVKLRIMELKKRNLEKSLEEGYKATWKEALETTNAFTHIDIENWDEY